jgi:hypothetical protein
MAFEVVALLKGSGPAEGPHLRLESLADGVLLHVSARFSGPDGDLVSAVRAAARGLVQAHDDPRGLFVFPAVPGLRASTYDDIVAEVAAAGRWLPNELLSDSVTDASKGAPADASSPFTQLLAVISTGEVGTLGVARWRALHGGDDQLSCRLREAWIGRLGGEAALLAHAERLTEAARAEVAEARLAGRQPDHIAKAWVEALDTMKDIIPNAEKSP